MINHKRIRERGKLSLAKYFEELKQGDKIALVRNLSFRPDFPRRMQGKTGKVVEKRGRAYVVKVMDGKKEKTYIVSKIHMKKLNQTKELR